MFFLSMSKLLNVCGAFNKGIIAYLTDKCGGNVREKCEVNVTPSSVCNINFAKYAVDLEGNQHSIYSQMFIIKKKKKR